MTTRRKILAVSSSGGHWVEMLRLRPAFEGHDIAWVTTTRKYRHDVEGSRFYAVLDATRWNKFRMPLMVAQIFLIFLRERPDIVVSTGAAPGYFALRLGKWFGTRCLWLESMANIHEFSLSTRLARPYADLCLTQWPHMAKDGSRYAGNVL
jgi:UDP-N-acetylglucosamine:LPS N-acetylglucosamine transferase